jgi:hypothetical protein
MAAAMLLRRRWRTRRPNDAELLGPLASAIARCVERLTGRQVVASATLREAVGELPAKHEARPILDLALADYEHARFGDRIISNARLAEHRRALRAAGNRSHSRA